MNRLNAPIGLRPLLATLAATAALHAPTYTQSQEATVTGILPYPTETRTLDNGLKIIVMPNAERRAHRLLVDRAHRLARRVRARPIRVRAFLRAHDVPRHGAVSGGPLSTHHDGARLRRERLHDRRSHGVPRLDDHRRPRASDDSRKRSVPKPRPIPNPHSRRRRARCTASIARAARIRFSRSTRR